MDKSIEDFIQFSPLFKHISSRVTSVRHDEDNHRRGILNENKKEKKNIWQRNIQEKNRRRRVWFIVGWFVMILLSCLFCLANKESF